MLERLAVPSRIERSPRWLLVLMLALSAVGHFGFGWLFGTVFRAPDLGIQFEVPIDVELGLSEETAFAPEASAPAPEPEPAKNDATAALDGDEPAPKPKKKKPEKPPVEDAGVPEGPNQLADPNAAPGSRLPPGAQIAVRVDMARIRASAIAEDIRGVLAAIPDWKALLDGSGIDPVDQLERLLIATPNLQRDKIVVAGRYLGGTEVVDQAVAKLAAARGVDAPWRTQGGVRVAPWANADDTPRVIALVGPQHFTISRPEDLPRVLAIAAARASHEDAGVKEQPADALLSMEADEGLSVEVDGVARFVKKAARGIPQKLRLSAVEVPGPKVELRGRMVFESSEQAADALGFWSGIRDKYARNTLVALVGLSGPLREAVLEVKDAELVVRVTLDVQQTRMILGYVRELLTPVPPSPAAAPSGTPAPGP